MYQIKRFFGISAKIVGRSHELQNKLCEDFVVVENNSKHQIMVLCDGISSVKYGLEGAKLVSKKVSFFLEQHDVDDFESLDALKKAMMHSVFDMLKQKAIQTQCNPTEYATTLCFVKNSPKGQIIGQLGDSQAFAFNHMKDIFHIPLKHKEFANYTHHVAKENADQHLDIFSFPKNTFKYFIVCSDGAAHSLVSFEKYKPVFANAIDLIVKGFTDRSIADLEKQIQNYLMPMLKMKTLDDCALGVLGLCELNFDSDIKGDSLEFTKLLECVSFTQKRDEDLLKQKLLILLDMLALQKNGIFLTYENFKTKNKTDFKNARYHFQKLKEVFFS